MNVEMHCHTIHSMDGLISLDSLIRTAALLGLDAIAVTDHDTIEGGKALRDLVRARNLDLKVVVGEEKTLDDGSHFIGYFLEEAIVSGTVEGAIEEIEAQGGICMIPHPFRKKDGLLRDGLERLALFEGKCAGFEVFNAKGSWADNRRALEALPAGMGPVGGSDAHYECDLGESCNEIAWAGEMRESVMRMFRREAPFRILGKVQRESAGERSYAPLYYRYKKRLKLPKPLVSPAKVCYRWYRNWRHGVGPKELREVYVHQ